MRFRLRTLLMLLAIVPPLLAWYGWPPLRRYLLGPPSIGFNGPISQHPKVQLVAGSEWFVETLPDTEEIDCFRHPFSGVIERYDPRTGKSDLEDFINGKLQPDKP